MQMAKVVCLGSSSIRPQSSKNNTRRRTANYKPNSWDYSSFSSSPNTYAKSKFNYCYEEMKNSIRSELIYKKSPFGAKLNLVDMLQRLGIAYHFSEEIRQVLDELIFDNAQATLKDEFAALVLLFRLMREHQYRVPEGMLKLIMNKYTPEDTEGLLHLYDASFLAFEGEKLLDEARILATNRLKQLEKTDMDEKLKEQLEHALDLPLHWRVPRLETRWFIDHYQGKENVISDITNFAKLDYNQVQLVHQGELSRLSRWWLDLGLKEKLPFARDRLVESFFYATGIAPEPHNADCREVICKLVVLIVNLDDVYDLYGTFDELLVFTGVIRRWDDIEAVNTLPDYMKTMYSVIYNNTKDIASYVLAKYGWDASPLLIKAWQDTCDSFLKEARWYHNGYRPSFDEYLENGWVSSTVPLLLTHAFAVVGCKTTIPAPNQQQKYANLIKSCATILRLSNDCATHHAEKERGDAPSSIACYMQQHLCTDLEACKAIESLIVDTWKKINEDSLGEERYALPRRFINMCVNLARITHCVYNGGDGIGAPNQKMKDLVRSLLIDSIRMD